MSISCRYAGRPFLRTTQHLLSRLRHLFLAALLSSGILFPDRGLALDPDRGIQQYNCLTWSHQYGLPANGVDAIAQTDDGFVWMGGSMGLVRFDGARFTLVGMAQSPRMHTQQVRALAPARGGGLWFGLKLSAYGKYDGREDWMLGTNLRGNSDWDVPAVLQGKDGRLWIGGEYAGVLPAQ